MLKYSSKILYLLGESKKSLILLMLSFLVTSILEAFSIGLVGPFIKIASEPEFIYKNTFLNQTYAALKMNSTGQFITLLGLFIIVFFLIKSCLYFLGQKYIYQFSYSERGKLCSKLLHSYITAPYTFHLSKNTAELIQKIIDETQRFSNGCLIPLLNLFANSIVIFVLIMLLVNTNALLVLNIVLILGVIFLIYYQFKGKIVQWGKETSEANTEIICIIKHSLGSLKETRIIGCEEFFENQMNVQTQKFASAFSSFQISQSIPRIVVEVIIIIFLVGFTSISLTFFEDKAQNFISVLSIFSVACIRLVPSISQLLNSMSQLQHNSYILDQLYLQLKEITEAKINSYKSLTSSNTQGKNEADFSSTDNSQLIRFNNHIFINQITYRYPNSSEMALNEIQLSIKKGQSIALIGKSGSGKTTLADIILGLLLPQNGDIIVDGVSIYKNLRAWQNLVGYIPQSIFLMDETLERNIAFGVPDNLIDLDKLSKAIQYAQLTELIEQLPNGIKTKVGENGIRLSGGQRQRIGIARTLYHEREVLVLDEATSALDTETETLVTEAIKSLAGKKTLIIIAHRLSTIEHCNLVYFLEKGHITKSGTYQEIVLNT
ncbi:MAG: ABC transporter ATP-binding protein [Nostoc sp. CreGUA01]|nr:ABC transporter ATP-binding protein [Nostoc sp. CreGUA01]